MVATDRSHEQRNLSREGKYLTFTMSQEDYGIGILKIKEIIGMMPITHVPGTPPAVQGVLNLRGKVIPVIDLRIKFGIDAGEKTDRTCIVVVEVKKASGEALVGLIVDSVSEVLSIRNEDVEDSPSFGTKVDTEYVLGLAKANDNVRILLDIDRVLGDC